MLNSYIDNAKRILTWGTGRDESKWHIMTAVGSGMKHAVVYKLKDCFNVTQKAVGFFDLIFPIDKASLMTAAGLLTPDGVVIASNKLELCFERYIAVKYIGNKLTVLSNPRAEKVFVVGLTHTGKNSVDAALQQYGMTYKHYPNPKRVIEESESYDVLTDTPVIQYIEMLDRLYPTAKFILTVRDMPSWLPSCKEHWANKKPTERQNWNRLSVYGTTTFNAKIFTNVYKNHYNFVLEYFKDKPDKLLVLDVCGGEGYEKLCPFLGLPMTEGPFPHRNRR